MPRFSTAFDYYATLDVLPTASREDIAANYRKLSRKHHPDLNPKHLHDKATEVMQRLNEAYHVLSNPATRREYDTFRIPKQAPQSAPHSSTRAHGNSTGSRDYDKGDPTPHSPKSETTSESMARGSKPDTNALPTFSHKIFFAGGAILFGFICTFSALTLLALLFIMFFDTSPYSSPSMGILALLALVVFVSSKLFGFFFGMVSR